jgi:hypothetical protein
MEYVVTNLKLKKNIAIKKELDEMMSGISYVLSMIYLEVLVLSFIMAAEKKYTSEYLQDTHGMTQIQINIKQNRMLIRL